MPAAANRLTIALAQIPAIVGDIAGNRDRLREARKEAAAFGADILLAPELYLSGYPPEDLVLKPAFQEACRAACEELARLTADGGPATLVGLPWVDEEGDLHNAMALLDGGRIEAVRFKVDLPNYGVFDEKRVFKPGPSPGPIVFRGVRLGVPICEDIWGPDPVECILETVAAEYQRRGQLELEIHQQRLCQVLFPLVDADACLDAQIVDENSVHGPWKTRGK